MVDGTHRKTDKLKEIRMYITRKQITMMTTRECVIRYTHTHAHTHANTNRARRPVSPPPPLLTSSHNVVASYERAWSCDPTGPCECYVEATSNDVVRQRRSGVRAAAQLYCSASSKQNTTPHTRAHVHTHKHTHTRTPLTLVLARARERPPAARHYHNSKTTPPPRHNRPAHPTVGRVCK